MKTVARYIWGKTDSGSGWVLWQEPQYAIEREGNTGWWSVYEPDGSLLCRCVDYRSARRVVAQVRKLVQAQVTPDAIPQVGLLKEGPQGWMFNMLENYQDFGEHFATREEAEARIQGTAPRPDTLPLDGALKALSSLLH